MKDEQKESQNEGDIKNYFDGYALFYRGECYPVNKFKFEFSVSGEEWEETTPENFDYLQAKGTRHKLRITPRKLDEQKESEVKRINEMVDRIFEAEKADKKFVNDLCEENEV